MLTTVSVVSSVLNTTLKAPVAKVAEVFGRVEALILMMVLYALGFICISQSPNVETYAASQIFYISAFTGTLMIIQLIVADTSSLANRTLISIMPGLPFLWTVWAGPALGQHLLYTIGWRWGIGMWSVIIPAASIPLIAILMIQRRRYAHLEKELKEAEKGDLSEALNTTSTQSGDHEEVEAGVVSEVEKKPLKERVFLNIQQMDIPGILLLAAGLGLVLIPLTLPREEATDLWTSWVTWVCIVSGLILLGGFGYYDGYYAQYPVVNLRMLKNRTIAALCSSQALTFATYYIYSTMFVSFLQVARFQSPRAAGQIQNCYSFCSTGSAVLAGFLIKYTKKYTIYVWLGAFLNMAGVLLMIPFRRPERHIAWLIFAQCVVGIGGGFYGTPGLVNSQGWASKKDVAAVTAIYLTMGPLGGAFGVGVAGAMWAASLRGLLRQHLAPEHHHLIRDIVGSIVVAQSYPEGSEIRTGIVNAYVAVMKRLCWVAGAVGIVFFLVTLLAKEPPNQDEAKEPEENQSSEALAHDESNTPGQTNALTV
eukprot:Protomagalhaensia_wolfi_Nauph_80__5937@NODE_788_length_1995_cov_66_485685_g594_i0_p1_GENE_NODE_788_length_1995_cov_66_485685_g594_i0NODE_788_length_1995_cov_66_485685_g594_i0_p1_ORF_typecomplete_len592_score128_01TRI12/PF06609_13/2_2e66MFS_1/PF07690_16/1_4e14MFS_1/PF07690_16/3_5e13Sugar_tr/PF00083_24/2_3e07Sugar_tr/PF00083_24/5_8OATP/PF03137_20/1OATP/PF03137_20/0_015_NODE_788_length_1995_cov_66_485685_g594_i02191829